MRGIEFGEILHIGIQTLEPVQEYREKPFRREEIIGRDRYNVIITHDVVVRGRRLVIQLGPLGTITIGLPPIVEPQ